MAEIVYPFLYSENLNGLEIVSRGLKQQKLYHDEKEYEMTWDIADNALLTQAKSEGTNIRNNDFYVAGVFNNCIEDPPCPWDKSGNNNLTDTNLMPVIFPIEGKITYRFGVYRREDNGTTSYEVKEKIADYQVNQSRLPVDKRADFNFFEYSGKVAFKGTAIFLIEKVHDDVVQDTFTYLFNLV